MSLLLDDVAALPAAGARVGLAVRVDGLGLWFHLTGYVARVGARESGSALAIELLVVPPEFEDLVQDELLSALECARLSRILLAEVNQLGGTA